MNIFTINCDIVMLKPESDEVYRLHSKGHLGFGTWTREGHEQCTCGVQ